MSVELDLFENVLNSNDHTINLTPYLSDWTRSILAIGGCWYGESPFRAKPHEMEEFFYTSLLKRVLERGGGKETWEGFIGEMALSFSNGDEIVRSVVPLANQTQVIYSKIGPNLFTNGSAESGAWTQVGTPSTHAVSTAWWRHGTQSMHVVTDAADEGTEIESNVTIVAGKNYDVRVSTKIESGVWTLYVYDTGTTDQIASRAAANDGEEVLKLQIPDTNTATGVDVQLLDSSGSGEIYADAAVIQLSPVRAETGVYQNASSIDAFGKKQLIMVVGGKTDVAARGLAQSELYKRAWPKTRGSQDPIIVGGIDPGQAPGISKPVGLIVSVYGYVDTMNWLYVVSTGGNANSSVHIASLVGESEFISAGSIATNTQDYLVKGVDKPLTLWEVAEDIIQAGDGSAPWTGGVYPGRVFNYAARPTTVTMFRQGRNVLSLNGDVIQPYSLRPGLVKRLDVGERPGGATGLDKDDPRVEFIREVSYSAANNEARLIRDEDRYG
jgi:hypothetical protein